MGRLGGYWAFCLTLLYLVGQFSGRLELTPGHFVPYQIIVAGYAAYQWLLATLFLQARRRAKSGLVFGAALLLALAPLITAKFLPLVSPRAEFGFLGISYVTFRVLDVLFCVQDGLITSLPAPEFFTYLFFFPTLSAGPIDRYRRFESDWKRVHSREDFLVNLDTAVERIFRGFLYKFILAALIKRFWVDHVTGRLARQASSLICTVTVCICFSTLPATAPLRSGLAICSGFAPRKISTLLSWRLIFATFGIAGISLFHSGFAIMFTCAF